jgi:hypothetical protein
VLINHRFLLASLHLDRILECTSIHDVRNYLDNAPRGIDKFYDESWDRSVGDGSSSKACLAREVLMWTACSQHKISTKALQDLLSASSFGNDTENVTEHEIVSACAGFARIESLQTQVRYQDDPDDPDDPDDTTATESSVVLTHATAYRYFDDRRELCFPRAHTLMFNACLSVIEPSKALYAIPILHGLLVR